MDLQPDSPQPDDPGVQPARQRREGWARLKTADVSRGHSNAALWLRSHRHNPATRPMATVLDL